MFVARGPSFRADGARLVIGEGDADSIDVTALTGRDADAATASRETGTDLDAVAATWERRTFVFDNTAVFAIVARALGMGLGNGTTAGDSAVLQDGRPLPRVDGALSARVFDALFDAGGGADDAKAKEGAVGAAVALFVAAAVSFGAFHLLDRRAVGQWPFEQARALLPLEIGAEQQLPEMESGDAETRGRGAA